MYTLLFYLVTIFPLFLGVSVESFRSVGHFGMLDLTFDNILAISNRKKLAVAELRLSNVVKSS